MVAALVTTYDAVAVSVLPAASVAVTVTSCVPGVRVSSRSPLSPVVAQSANPEPPLSRHEKAGVVEEPWATEAGRVRSEEHTSELQSQMRISYAVFCLKKKKTNKKTR